MRLVNLASFLFISTALPALGVIEVVDIPETEHQLKGVIAKQQEPIENVVNLALKEFLPTSFAYLKVENWRPQKISFLTASEARLYPSELRKHYEKKIHPDHIADFEKQFFTDKYFGKSPDSFSYERDFYNFVVNQINNYSRYILDDAGNLIKGDTFASFDYQPAGCPPPYHYSFAFRAANPSKVKEFVEQNQLSDQLKRSFEWALKSKGMADPTAIESQSTKILDQLFSTDHGFLGFPSEDAREEYLAQDAIGDFPHAGVQDVFKTATKMLDHTKDGDTFIFFGNTPYFLGRAVEAILSATPDQRRSLISFPFSGAPNRAREVWSVMPQDATTPERVDYLMSYLAKQGLSPENPALDKGKIYLVDSIASGGGPSFALEELIRSYQKAGKLLPDLNVMTMKLITDPNDHRTGSNYKIGSEERKYYFPSLEETHFTIDFLDLDMKWNGNLDNVEGHRRFYPSYNAQYWNEEYAFLLEPRSNPYMDLFTAYFDTHLERLMKESPYVRNPLPDPVVESPAHEVESVIEENSPAPEAIPDALEADISAGSFVSQEPKAPLAYSVEAENPKSKMFSSINSPTVFLSRLSVVLKALFYDRE